MSDKQPKKTEEFVKGKGWVFLDDSDSSATAKKEKTIISPRVKIIVKQPTEH